MKSCDLAVLVKARHPTLTSFTAVHGEVGWLVSLEPGLLHSRPIDLDFVWMGTLTDQHLMSSQCT